MELTVAPKTIDSSVSRPTLLSKDDAINLCLLALGFILVLCLVSPVRSFPITDDWSYLQAVDQLLRWDYHPPRESQANLLSHVAWGALFVLAFGGSFTTLTIATLTASASCLVGCYLLLRHLAVTPRFALLGAAALGCNPIYLYLSYSFMTDITFLACWVWAGLFFVRGFQGYGERWLWLGSIMCALAYLARQPGVLLAVAAISYLLWTRRWSWRSAVGIAGVPILAVLAYTLWESTQPSNLVSGLLSRMMADITADPVRYLRSRLPFIGLLVNAFGLFFLPVLRLPRRPLLAMPLFGALAVLLFLNTHFNGSAFPTNGNVLDRTGFVMWGYGAAPIWAEWVWALIGILSAFVLALYITALLEKGLKSLRLKRRESRKADPAYMLYILAALMGAFVFFVTPVLFDRYMLPVLPLLMIPALRRISLSEPLHENSGSRASIFSRWGMLGILAVFSIVCMRDYMDHATVRWQAAQELVGRGIPRDQIDAGFEWQGLYWPRSGKPGEEFPSQPNIRFKLSDLPVEGYAVIGSLPYSSWLSGGETRQVLLLERR